jgi:hypothetical protein
MTVNDIKVGQIYRWDDGDEYIIHSIDYTRAIIVWRKPCTNIYIDINSNYTIDSLLTSVNAGYCKLVFGETVQYKMDRFKFV